MATTDDRTKARAAVLRSCCRGWGMDYWQFANPQAARLFHGSPSFVVNTIVELQRLLPESLALAAIRNALHIDPDGKWDHSKRKTSQLGQRREQFMKDHGVSLRTVIRYEERGALLIAQEYDKAVERARLDEKRARSESRAATKMQKRFEREAAASKTDFESIVDVVASGAFREAMKDRQLAKVVEGIIEEVSEDSPPLG